MGTTVDSILQLQRDYRTLAGEWRRVTETYTTLNAQYGGSRDQRHARLEEIKRQLAEPMTVSSKEHIDEFDSSHNLRIDGKRRTWRSVPGCPSCDRIDRNDGTAARREERDQIYAWGKELNGYLTRLNELHEGCVLIAEEMDRHAEHLGLPSFDGQLTIDSDFITSATVSSFSARGQYLLDSGISITYGETTVVLDNSEQIVAYRSGGSDWTITSVDATHTARIRFSGVHQGDQPYPHVDANKRVDGKKVRDRSGHHQEQSPGYGPEEVSLPIRHTDEG